MGLLQKFRNTEKKPTLKEEIVEHLADFLNTKKNLGVFPLDYGIDSYVYLGTDKRVELQLMEEIQAGLEKYEKRILEVQVLPLQNDSCFMLSFQIKCKIEEKDYSFQLSFHHQKKQFNFEVSP